MLRLSHILGMLEMGTTKYSLKNFWFLRYWGNLEYFYKFFSVLNCIFMLLNKLFKYTLTMYCFTTYILTSLCIWNFMAIQTLKFATVKKKKKKRNIDSKVLNNSFSWGVYQSRNRLPSSNSVVSYEVYECVQITKLALVSFSTSVLVKWKGLLPG